MSHHDHHDEEAVGAGEPPVREPRRRIRDLMQPEIPYVEPTPADLILATVRETFPARAIEAAAAPTLDLAAAAIVAIRPWTERSGIAVIAGNAGTGKTVATTWLALQLDEYAAPRFLTAQTFAKLSSYDEDARKSWRKPRWLVLDDVGTEYADAKGHLTSAFDELFDWYYSTGRTLIVTTNLEPMLFRARYGERVVDRIREAGEWLSVVGPSLRGQRKA